MKHKISKLMITIGISATLAACVEVKDKNKDGQVVIQTIEGGDLVVDEPLFLHEGQFLSQDAFQQIPSAAGSPHQEYQFIFASLKMGPRGVLHTMGHNVRFKVHSLAAASGGIATFPSDSLLQKQGGRAGGHIEVLAENAEGILNFYMRGENGTDSDVRTDAANGGSSGTLSVEVAASPGMFKTSVEIIPGKGGSALADAFSEVMGIHIQLVKGRKAGQPGASQTACISVQKQMQCKAESFNYMR